MLTDSQCCEMVLMFERPKLGEHDCHTRCRKQNTLSVWNFFNRLYLLAHVLTSGKLPWRFTEMLKDGLVDILGENVVSSDFAFCFRNS